MYSMTDTFPGIFCIEDIQHSYLGPELIEYRVILYHDQACITVSFNSKYPDPILDKGAFVSVRWLPKAQSEHGAIQVAGLIALKYPVRDFNPLQAIPHTWSIDRRLIICARDLWDISSRAMKQMLFATVMAQQNHPASNLYCTIPRAGKCRKTAQSESSPSKQQGSKTCKQMKTEPQAEAAASC